MEWVKGHSNVQGNEAADAFAKYAALLDQPDLTVTRPSYRCCRGEIKDQIGSKHQRRWTAAEGAAHTRNLVDKPTNQLKVKLLSLRRRELGLVIQAITGHGNVAKHRHRIGKSETAACPKCQEAVETMGYHIEDCPVYTIHRFSYLNGNITSLKDIIKEGEVRQLARFLTKSGRLDEF